MHQPTLRDVNQMNVGYWRDAIKRFHQTITEEPTILQEATDDLRADSLRYPVRLQRPLEKAVFDVKDKRDLHHRQFSLKGARARKLDSLSRFIEDIVERHPKITASELLICMKNHAPVQPIAEIDDEDIHLSDGKVVPIGGLKDRLSRTKKKLKSRDR